MWQPQACPACPERSRGKQSRRAKLGDGWKLKEIPDTDFVIKTYLVLLAMGFLHVEHEGLIKNLGLRLDEKGNVVVDNFQTSVSGVFATGDAVSRASLVVRAIDSGRLVSA